MFQNQFGGPGLHDLMKELRAILDQYPGDRMFMGEDDDIAYLGNGADELHLVFNFPLIRAERMTPTHIRAEPGGAPGPARHAAGPRLGLQYAGQPRHVAHLHLLRHLVCGRPGARPAKRGPGADAGRHAVPLQRRGDRYDRSDHHRSRPSCATRWRLGTTVRSSTTWRSIRPKPRTRAEAMSRDKNRTPMQWTGQPHAGFCPTGETPWLPVNPNYAGRHQRSRPTG